MEDKLLPKPAEKGLPRSFQFPEQKELCRRLDENVEISFLLGSGVSLPAGMPGTEDLTKLVLEGSGWGRHTDARYYPNFRNVVDTNAVKAIVKYLEIIKIEIAEFYNNNRKDWGKFNYELLYYVITQLDDSMHGEFENPAVYALIKKISPDVNKILLENGLNNWDFNRLSRETKQYIKCVIAISLKREPTSRNHLGVLVEACKARSKNLKIFTLNHDAVVEKVLKENGIQFSDGFGASINNVRYWNPKLYEESNGCVKYFKIHGSVDWYRFVDNKIGIINNGDPDHSKNENGELQAAVGTAQILAGTFNKLLSYASGIYSELYFQFHKGLKDTDILIVSGYSFGDKGINSKIIEWLTTNENRRLVVIHADPAALGRAARGAISNKWNNWLNRRVLICVKKWFSDTSWTEVENAVKIPHRGIGDCS